MKQFLLMIAVVVVGCGTAPTKEKIAGIYSAGEREEVSFFANGVAYDGRVWIQWQLKGREIHVDSPDGLYRSVFRINENNSITLIRGVRLDDGKVKEPHDGQRVTIEKLAEKKLTPAMINEASIQKATLEKAAVRKAAAEAEARVRKAAAEAEMRRQAQKVTISDPIIDKKIRKRLNNITGQLTVGNLERITELIMTDTLITDEALKDIGKLKNLTELYLFGCERITDAGLSNLSTLEKLALLNLQYTKVTNAGISRLQKALPKCEIKGP